MLKKWGWVFLTAALVLTGCSDNEKKEEKAQGTEEKASGVEETKSANEKSPADEDNEEERTAVGEVSTPETIEEFMDIQPGELTKEIPFDKETSPWPNHTPIKGMEEELKSGMGDAAESTTADLFQSLVYLLGNSAYPELVNEMASMEPDFDEPLLPEPEEVKGSEGKAEDDGKAIILLDASSSMLLEVDSKQKMAVAKTAVRSFAKTIGETNDVSLYVYGHEGSQEDKDKELSCSKIDEIYPMKAYNEKTFFEAVEGVEAKGWTPLADAIKTAREDSKSYEGNLTVYIVSDGAETCDGDPVEEAKAFASDGEDRQVNIIGFNVDKDSADQLKKVAEAGNGDYIGADNADQLKESIRDQWVPSSLDIMSAQWASPKTSFSVLTQKRDIEKLSLTLGHAIQSEKRRFEKAASFLEEEGMISDEQSKEITAMAAERDQKLNELSKELLENKQKEIDAEVERIDKKINDWADRMKKLREEQGR